MKKIINKIICNERLLVIAFLVLLLLTGFGQILRWDLSQQLAMADHLFNNGSLYPGSLNPNDLTYPVSIYPPGLALIAYAFLKIGFNSILPEAMLTLASLIIILMIYLIKTIMSKWTKTDTFIPFMIFSFCFLLDIFLYYSTEFKPDIIAFLISLSGIYIFVERQNWSSVFVGSALVALGLVFKQQQISILGGIIIFALINYKEKKWIIFSLLSTIYSSAIIFYYVSDNVLYHYIIDLVSDDGWLSLKPILGELINQVKRIAFYIPVIFLLLLNKYRDKIISIKFNKQNFKFQKLKYILFSQPWVIIAILILGQSFLGGFHVGGNRGNYQVGIFFIIPFIYLIINHKRKIALYSFAWISLLLIIPTTFQNYFTYREGKAVIENHINNNSVNKIIIDSNSYPLVRQYLNKNIEIIDFWMPSRLYDEYPNIEYIKGIEDIGMVIYTWPLSFEEQNWLNEHFNLIYNERGLNIYKKR